MRLGLGGMRHTSACHAWCVNLRGHVALGLLQLEHPTRSIRWPDAAMLCLAFLIANNHNLPLVEAAEPQRQTRKHADTQTQIKPQSQLSCCALSDTFRLHNERLMPRAGLQAQAFAPRRQRDEDKVGHALRILQRYTLLGAHKQLL